MDWWISFNHGEARRDTLAAVEGKLEAMQELGDKCDPADLLAWIKQEVERREADLNRRYPEKA